MGVAGAVGGAATERKEDGEESDAWRTVATTTTVRHRILGTNSARVLLPRSDPDDWEHIGEDEDCNDSVVVVVLVLVVAGGGSNCCCAVAGDANDALRV